MARAPKPLARGWRGVRDRRRAMPATSRPAEAFTIPSGAAVDVLRELARRARGALVFERGGAVRLVALDGAVRRSARFASPEAAVAALKAGRVTWVALPLPEYAASLASGVKRKFETLRDNY